MVVLYFGPFEFCSELMRVMTFFLLILGHLAFLSSHDATKEKVFYLTSNWSVICDRCCALFLPLTGLHKASTQETPGGCFCTPGPLNSRYFFRSSVKSIPQTRNLRKRAEREAEIPGKLFLKRNSHKCIRRKVKRPTISGSLGQKRALSFFSEASSFSLIYVSSKTFLHLNNISTLENRDLKFQRSV